MFAGGTYYSTVNFTLINLDATNTNSSIILSKTLSDYDAFLLKINSSGIIIAYTNIRGDNYNDSIETLTVDSVNNLYIGGYYRSITYNVSLSNLNATSSVTNYFLPKTARDDSTYNNYQFLIKYNSSGTLVGYSTILSTSLNNSINNISVDINNNLYASGYYNSTFQISLSNLNLTSSVSTLNLPLTTSQSGFIIKYNSSGILTGYSTIYGNGTINTLLSDKIGNIYIGGNYNSGTVVSVTNLDFTQTISLPISSVPYGFVIKYNSDAFILNLPTVTNNLVFRKPIYLDTTLYSSNAMYLINNNNILKLIPINTSLVYADWVVNAWRLFIA